MHRSGTSAAARVVNLLGVPLGDPVDRTPPSAANPAGLWESTSLTEWNDRVLEALGGSWAAPPPTEDGVWLRPEITALQREAIAQFHEIHSTESWVWKDPRNCLTLPFWRPALAERPAILLVCRDPREVAASLSTRDGCSPRHGVALWERYVRAALANAEGLPTFVLGYAELLSDAAGAAQRLDEFLRWAGLERTGNGELAAIRAFIDPKLHRARPGQNGHGIELSPAQSELARQLDVLAGPHERLGAVALPAETPLTELIVGEKRGPELRARRLESDLRRLEARTRQAEALAEARGVELARAAPYARGLESRIANQEVEISELRALAEAQAEALGVRAAEVEALGAALAERSALAARHLISNRTLHGEVRRLASRVEELAAGELGRLVKGRSESRWKVAARSALHACCPLGTRRRAVVERLFAAVRGTR